MACRARGTRLGEGAALRDGETAHALALADSAVTLVSGGSSCLPTGRAQRGEALLALGDTLAAAREFSQAYGFESWQNIDAREAIATRLRPSVAGAAWEAMRVKAEADRKACMRGASRRDSLDQPDR